MYKRNHFLSNEHFLVVCGLEMGVIKDNELVPQFRKFCMEIDNE